MIAALQLISTFAALVILLLSIYKREIGRSPYLTFAILSIFHLNLGYLVEISAPVKEIAILGKQLKYLGIPFISPFVLLFVLDYYGIKKLSKLKTAALLAIPILHCMLAISFPFNGIYYTNTHWVTDTSVPYIKFERSVFYYAGLFYTYCLALYAFSFALIYSRRNGYVTKKQSAVIIASIVVPLIWSAFNVLTPFRTPFDITPIMLSGACVLLGISLLWLKQFQIAPIAREQIIENMKDAFILTDQNGLFIDANAAAKKLFPGLAIANVGAPVADIEDIPWTADQSDVKNWTFSLKNESGLVCHYCISKTVISHPNNTNTICDCIMIYDVTEHKELLDEASELAERDTLTGLNNRRTFYKRGEWLFHEIASSGGNMSVFMMDLDHFKDLNDTYGHQAGDNVLRTVARNLCERFRSTDLFARYGGDEFCAFLPRTDVNSAMRIAGELREITERINWENAFPGTRVTLSIGVAVYSVACHTTLDSLIGSADTALYAAKNAGRNNVCLYNRSLDKTYARPRWRP